MEASIELFLELGMDRVTVDEIAQRAGIAKGSFYRYFSDRTGLAEAIFAPIRETTLDAIDACERALLAADSLDEVERAWTTLGLRLAPLFLEHPALARLYLQEARGPAVGARVPLRELGDLLDESAVRLTHAAQRRGLLKPLPAAVVARAVIGAVERLMLAVLESPESIGDPLDVLAALVTMLFDGLRSPDGGVT